MTDPITPEAIAIANTLAKAGHTREEKAFWAGFAADEAAGCALYLAAVHGPHRAAETLYRLADWLACHQDAKDAEPKPSWRNAPLW